VQLMTQLLKVLGSLELEHLPLHVVVLSDLVQVFLVFLGVIDGHRDTFATEAARTPKPFDVGLWVPALLAIGQLQSRWRIKVDHNFHFGNVEVPSKNSKHVCSDDDVGFALAELFHG
jgi:hypothetical protein